MSGRLRNHIQTTTEYEEVAGRQSGGGDGASSSDGQPADPLEALDAVTDLEKGDVQFWCIVIQTIVLAAIWYELHGGS